MCSGVPIAGEWIAHDGFGVPLAVEQVRAVIFRNGATLEFSCFGKMSHEHWVWMDPPSGLEVLAYLVAETAIGDRLSGSFIGERSATP